MSDLHEFTPGTVPACERYRREREEREAYVRASGAAIAAYHEMVYEHVSSIKQALFGYRTDTTKDNG